MLSRKEGRNYVVLRAGERIPLKLNAKRLDGRLGRIEKALETIGKELKDAYRSDYEEYALLREEIFENAGSYVSFDEGKCSIVDNLLYGLRQMKETLAGEDDEILPEEEVVTLRDFGYEELYRGYGIWEKVLENSEEREVVEEIQRLEDPLRRIRTTNWKRTDYGKTSTSITYRKLPIGKKLAKAIENTKKEK